VSTGSVSFEDDVLSGPRKYYGSVARDGVRLVWDSKLMVAVAFAACLAVGTLGFMLITPQFSGEAIIKLDFVRSEPAGAGERLQSTASVDAAAEVASAARILRSRTIASQVVTTLRLDRDPSYIRPSRVDSVVATLRHALAMVLRPVGIDLETAEPTSYHDRAVERFMGQVNVANDTRSYLVTLTVSDKDPNRAAELANWLASEYLHDRVMQQTRQAYAAAEREFSAVSSVFGPKHPRYLEAQEKLMRLKDELLANSRNGAIASNEGGEFLPRRLVEVGAGQYLLPAQPVTKPSWPDPFKFFAFLAVGSLGVIAALLWAKRHGWIGASRRDPSI